MALGVSAMLAAGVLTPANAAESASATALPQTATAVPALPVGKPAKGGSEPAGKVASVTTAPKPGAAPPNPVKPADSAVGFDRATSKVVSRGAFENVFENTDGTRTAQFSTVPLNVQDSTGAWGPVSTKLVADSSTGGLQVVDHPLMPTFAKQSGASGEYSVTVAGHTVSFGLEGADSVAAGDAPAGDISTNSGSATDALAYNNVLPGEDLTYQVQPSGVKETLVLHSAPVSASPSWTWRIHAPGLTLSKDYAGSILFKDSAGDVQFLTPTPVMEDSSGVAGVSEPSIVDVPTTLSQSADGDWELTLTPDAAWLNSPARVYPVFVDPSTASSGPNDEHSYESNGTAVTGVAWVGNSRANGDTYWRTVTHFNYEQLFGYEVLGADLDEWYGGSGTLDSEIGAVDYATAFSYNGVGQFLSPITISAGSSGYGDATAAGLANQLSAWVNAGSSGNYLMLGGNEAAGAYTYKSLGLELYISYVAKPSVSIVQVATTAGPKTSPASSTGYGPVAPTLQVTGSDSSSTPMNYKYEIGTSVSMSTLKWSTGWTSSTSVPVPMGTLQPMTTYYWTVYAEDGYGELVSTPVYYWTTGALPVLSAGVTLSPAGQSVIPTAQPSFVVASATDATSPIVSYSVRIATGADGTTGQVVQSDPISMPSSSTSANWQVPAGILRDGGKYTWVEVINDTTDIWTSPPLAFTVSSRVTDPGPAPTDTAGPVTVNMANGNVNASFSSPTVDTVGGAMGYAFNYNSQLLGSAGLEGSYYNLNETNPVYSFTGLSPQLVRRDTSVQFNWNTT